uniref:Uncharacterized protein n=1 Tax=Heterosigma akashiwo TaxID=2829 RepID=A0A6V1M8Q3_HETAK
MLALPKADIILGADCLYNSEDFDDFLATVHFLMSKNPTCVFYGIYHERSANRNIHHLLEKWGLAASGISLSGSNREPYSTRISVTSCFATDKDQIRQQNISSPPKTNDREKESEKTDVKRKKFVIEGTEDARKKRQKKRSDECNNEDERKNNSTEICRVDEDEDSYSSSSSCQENESIESSKKNDTAELSEEDQESGDEDNKSNDSDNDVSLFPFQITLGNKH